MDKEESRLLVSGGITVSLVTVGTGLKLGFPDMIVPFGWAMALAAIGVVSLGATLIFGYLALVRKPKHHKPEGPIFVSSHASAEALKVIDEHQQPIDGIEAVCLFLFATNIRSDGATLRNVQARLHFIDGNSTVLAIRNVQDQTCIRHGEIAHIEVGHVPIVTGEAMAGHSNRPAVQLDRRTAEHNPKSGFRTLYVGSGMGGNQRGIAQSTRDQSFPNIYVMITADDIPAKRIWLDMNLYQEKAWEWLTVKSEPTYDED